MNRHVTDLPGEPAPDLSGDACDGPVPPLDTSRPVLLLGGGGNAVSAARNLSRRGVRVGIAGDRSSWGLASRHCHRSWRAPEGADLGAFWHDLLLGRADLRGHVLMALCDEAIDFLCAHRDALAPHFAMEAFDPEYRRTMLDKKATLEIARAAGVPVPNSWTVRTLEDVDAARGEIRFPAMIKPIHSHLFIPVMGRKLFIVTGQEGFGVLREKAALALDHGLEIMVVEMIPGPDDLLSSYYTYVDDHGRWLVHYTKSVIRRFPVNRGGGCYHRSHWLPETAAMGQRFFAGMPWRGMGNVEFKRDPRDGLLKVIECNPRFTAAHRLVTASGVPLDEIVYRSATGQPVPRCRQSDADLRMWNPMRDAMAFAELRRRGELGAAGWLRSLVPGRKLLPVFEWSDPMPSLRRLGQEGGRALRRIAGRR